MDIVESKKLELIGHMTAEDWTLLRSVFICPGMQSPGCLAAWLRARFDRVNLAVGSMGKILEAEKAGEEIGGAAKLAAIGRIKAGDWRVAAYFTRRAMDGKPDDPRRESYLRVNRVASQMGVLCSYFRFVLKWSFRNTA